MSKRLAYIDTAKGICIILVVANHCNLHYNDNIDNLLSCIRMPLYYFLSGLFFKLYEGYGYFLRKKINRLLVPFIFFYLVTSIILPNIFYYLFEYKINTVYGWSSFYAFIYPEVFPNIPIWFLWSLFLSNVLFYGILILFRNNYLINIIIILLGILGFFLHYCEIELPAFIDNTLYFFPFFFIGYCYQHMDNVELKEWIIGLLAVISILLAYVLSNIKCNYLVFDMFYYYLSCVLGIFFIIFLSYKLDSVLFVTYVGRYSIIILVTHCLILQSIQKLIVYIGITEDKSYILIFVFTMLSYLIVIPLMKRYLPYFTAQKDLI